MMNDVMLVPLTWAEYKGMKKYDQESYYKTVKARFHVRDERIAAMMGVARRTLEDYNRTIGIKPIRGQETEDRIAEWERFCNRPTMPVTETQWEVLAQRALAAERKLEAANKAAAQIRKAAAILTAYAAKIEDPVLPVVVKDMLETLADSEEC